MVKHRHQGPGRTFSFRKMRASDLPVIERWVALLDSPARSHREKIKPATSLQYPNGWKSPWDQSWMMTVDGRPAFCLSLHTETAPQDGGPRPESGCGNQLFLLSSPRISRWPHRLLRAWYAATIYVFLHVRVDQVQILLSATADEEGEGLKSMGYRVIETTTEAGETYYLYLCKREEFIPIL